MLGQDLSVSFPGDGWIYLGTVDGSDAVNFVNKTVLDGESRFVFRVTRPGNFTLQFERQNLRTGSQEDRHIALRIVTPPPDFGGRTPRGTAMGGGTPMVDNTVAAGNGSSVPRATSTPSGTPVAGAAAVGTGTGASPESASAPAAGPAAQSTGTSGSAGSSPVAPASQPSGTAAQGSAPAGPSGTVGKGTSATSGAIMGNPTSGSGRPAASSAGTQQTQPENSTPTFDLATAGGLLAGAKYQLSQANATEAEKLLNEYIDRYNYTNNADEAYYLLAKLYEQDAKVRNIEKSLQYYTMLRNEFPLSSYWEEAGKQIRYITRHFIYVR